MNDWTIIGLALAAVTTGALIGATLAWALFRTESEESSAARRAALGRVARARTPAPRCVRCGVEQFEWPEHCSDEDMLRLRCPSGTGHFFTDDPAVAAMVAGGSVPLLDRGLLLEQWADRLDAAERERRAFASSWNAAARRAAGSEQDLARRRAQSGGEAA